MSNKAYDNYDLNNPEYHPDSDVVEQDLETGKLR